jgi:hypothetical protein
MRTINKHILNNFPNIELFYNLTYKKVSNYNLILAIPRGNKCFIWFTKINGKKSAILINIDITSTNTNKINFNFSNIYLLNNQFNSELLETILYGTSFEVQNKFYFSIEDLFYYKKLDLSHELFSNKLNIINNILVNDIYKINDYDNSFIIGIPPICTNYFELNNIIKNLSYEIKELKYILLNETNVYVKYKNNVNNIIQSKQKIIQQNIFKVIPDMKTDIYNLYLLNKSKNDYEFHSIAFIPDYKSSIKMNKLFHGLKEHDNLDYLEDSDDEFEIENNLENNWKIMECIFNNKFKKWIPIKVIE